MEKKIDAVNRLDWDKATAHKTMEQFKKMKGAFFLDEIYEWREDENGKKVQTDKIINRFVRELIGPRNADGSIPDDSQGDTLAFVATNFDPDKEGCFAAFKDDDGLYQWILMNKPQGFTKTSRLVFE